MSRTRSLEAKNCLLESHPSSIQEEKEATHPISPKGGLIIISVTTRTSLILFLVDLSSAIISFVDVVQLG
jgi:hypothetical protein